MLDKAIFPAVAGIAPRGSRRARLERWRSALNVYRDTPEALCAALTECDPAMKGMDGLKALAAIRLWYAEQEKEGKPNKRT
jgi:hypothetical protein